MFSSCSFWFAPVCVWCVCVCVHVCACVCVRACIKFEYKGRHILKAPDIVITYIHRNPCTNTNTPENTHTQRINTPGEHGATEIEVPTVAVSAADLRHCQCVVVD